MSHLSQNSIVVVGAFYELPDNRIARVFGHSTKAGEHVISYYHDDGNGSRTATCDDLATWKIRRDLDDFPNARDPRLPYVFDLFWDIKHVSELREALSDPDCDPELQTKAAEHGFSKEQS